MLGVGDGEGGGEETKHEEITLGKFNLLLWGGERGKGGGVLDVWFINMISSFPSKIALATPPYLPQTHKRYDMEFVSHKSSPFRSFV